MRKIATYSFVALSFLMMISFQNCSSGAQFSQTDTMASGSEKVDTGGDIAVETETSSMNQVLYVVHDQRFVRNNLNKTRLNLNLATGAMSVDKALSLTSKTAAEGVKKCQLDAERLRRIDNVVKTAKICNGRDEVKPGMATCMAIGVADIQLVNYDTKASVQLSPNICNSGVYLCDGVDQEFRTQLADVLTNLPEGCL